MKVVVGLRKGGASWDKVGEGRPDRDGIADAVKAADVVMILLPDEQIAEVYSNNVEPNIKKGASLAFAHGFNVHYNQVVPAPTWTSGWSPPRPRPHRAQHLHPGWRRAHLVAVHQDKSGKAVTWP